MSKVIQITPPNPRFRTLLAEATTKLEKMDKEVRRAMRGLSACGSVDVVEHETDEELVRIETDLRPVDREALVALVELCSQIRGTITTLRRVADGKGRAAPDFESGPSLVDTDLLEVLGSRDGIRGWLEHSELRGSGPRPMDLLRIDSLTVESIDNGRRVIARGTGLDASGEEGEVRVVTDENLKPDIEQYLAPMRGTWEWLEVEESE